MLLDGIPGMPRLHVVEDDLPRRPPSRLTAFLWQPSTSQLDKCSPSRRARCHQTFLPMRPRRQAAFDMAALTFFCRCEHHPWRCRAKTVPPPCSVVWCGVCGAVSFTFGYTVVSIAID